MLSRAQARGDSSDASQWSSPSHGLNTLASALLPSPAKGSAPAHKLRDASEGDRANRVRQNRLAKSLKAAVRGPVGEAPPRMAPISDDEADMDENYSRKEKSLGLLCQGFMALYASRVGREVSLDSAAQQLGIFVAFFALCFLHFFFSLGVERRRIYDIVNVLESLKVMIRLGKNRYQWMGVGAIQGAVTALASGVPSDEPSGFGTFLGLPFSSALTMPAQRTGKRKNRFRRSASALCSSFSPRPCARPHCCLVLRC